MHKFSWLDCFNVLVQSVNIKCFAKQESSKALAPHFVKQRQLMSRGELADLHAVCRVYSLAGQK